MAARPPQLDGDLVARELTGLSRAPFQEILVRLLGATPEADTLERFANEHPDKWVRAVAVLSRLAGYHEKLQVDTNINAQLSQMSDIELMDRLRQLEEEGALPRRTVN